MVIYLIDISGEEGRDPYEDFLTLRREVEAYSPAILKKPFLVALNKTDKGGEHLEVFKKRYLFENETLFEISALEGKGLNPLTLKMRALAQAESIKYH